ncbi:PLAT/LH2 domain-containing protein [Robiginitomaculum antarcticum]|uniref:PLAT/LH2 domain-containing protein n=1 Tax=Robiginitomaculum antarcticum TaxID=437507 RepID=UPI000374DCF3|nr:PLAT/LH2 domain-containing protein [Robiginitomaculum antarcticum]
MSKIYTVEVYTADEKNAGTNADVKIKLVGKAGQSGPLHLDHPDGTRTWFMPFKVGGTNDHERDSDSTYYFNLDEDLGGVTKILIGHNNKRSAAGWKVAKVVITSGDYVSKTIKMGLPPKDFTFDDFVVTETNVFTMNQWIANDEPPFKDTEAGSSSALLLLCSPSAVLEFRHGHREWFDDEDNPFWKVMSS